MYVLKNADLYTPKHVGLSDVLVAGTHIVRVAPEIPSMPSGLDVEIVQLGGARVIPGLVDCHVHVTGGGGEAGARSRVPPLTVTDLTTHGVTTVVGLLGTDDVTRNTESLLAAARALAEDGITTYCLTGGYHVPPVTLTGSVRGDIVHLDRVIGVGELAVSDHRSSQPTRDEILRIAGDAHVAGLMTGKAGILHLHLGDGDRGLAVVRDALEQSELPPAVFHPTHVNRRRDLFEEALALAERGVTVDITAFPVADDDDQGWSTAQALRLFWERGLPETNVTVSSDAGGCLPEFDDKGRVTHFDVGRCANLLSAVADLVDGGVPLETALPPFTTNPASLLRFHRKGTVAPGSDADLVVLDSSGRPRDVMALGTWHIKNGEPVVRGAFG